jgi:hypothetical protein
MDGYAINLKAEQINIRLLVIHDKFILVLRLKISPLNSFKDLDVV